MKLPLALSYLISLTAAHCHHGTTFFPRAVGAVPVADFTFIGLDGPLNWYGMTPDNYLCGLGTNQSPIDINTAGIECIPGSDLAFDIHSCPNGADFINIGSQVEVFANGTICLDGKEYELVQFHFHTPSEHLLDSEFYSLESHFVFQAKDESLAVVGFMIEVSCGDGILPLFDCVFQNLNDIRNPGTATVTGSLDFKDLQAHLANTVVYRYPGSLTVPPCSEGVAWLVAKAPVFISVETFIKVKSVVKFNSRYTQNTPGAINLLDNSRIVLDRSG